MTPSRHFPVSSPAVIGGALGSSAHRTGGPLSSRRPTCRYAPPPQGPSARRTGDSGPPTARRAATGPVNLVAEDRTAASSRPRSTGPTCTAALETQSRHGAHRSRDCSPTRVTISARTHHLPLSRSTLKCYPYVTRWRDGRNSEAMSNEPDREASWPSSTARATSWSGAA